MRFKVHPNVFCGGPILNIIAALSETCAQSVDFGPFLFFHLLSARVLGIPRVFCARFGFAIFLCVITLSGEEMAKLLACDAKVR